MKKVTFGSAKQSQIKIMLIQAKAHKVHRSYVTPSSTQVLSAPKLTHAELIELKSSHVNQSSTKVTSIKLTSKLCQSKFNQSHNNQTDFKVT